MEISVKMDAEEFQEFMEYREAKGKFEAALERVKKAPAIIAASLMYAVEPVAGKPGKWKIVDQEHMDDAMSMAAEYQEKKKTTRARC
jgi:sarcosine oxidase gamma subunit